MPPFLSAKVFEESPGECKMNGEIMNEVNTLRRFA